jgi:uncharacterized membrane protein
MSENEKLLEQLRKNAEAIGEELAQEPSTLAVILTGPLALGSATGGEKLYFAVIMESADGAIEHEFLDGCEEVPPIEIGRFPLSVARYLIKHGYADMVSYKSLEAFRCGEVLWERDGVGAEMVEGAKRHVPKRAFVGESLHGAVSALDDAVSLMKNGDFANAVLVAREAVVRAVAMVTGRGAGDEGASLLEAAAAVLPPEQLESFREIMGLAGVQAESASEAARRARGFAEHALREIGVDPERVLGSRKGPAT